MTFLCFFLFVAEKERKEKEKIEAISISAYDSVDMLPLNFNRELSKTNEEHFGTLIWGIPMRKTGNNCKIIQKISASGLWGTVFGHVCDILWNCFFPQNKHLD